MEKKKPKKKNQLTSGNYRVQIYDYTDAAGKKHYKSFTAPTKKEAWNKFKETGEIKYYLKYKGKDVEL